MLPVVKIIFCLNRRPELSFEEFSNHWRDTHAPLVRKTAAEFGVVEYHQLRPSSETMSGALAEFRGAPGLYDGVAEVTFESLEAMTAALKDPSLRGAARHIIGDEAKFIDFSRSPIGLYEDERFV